MIYYHANPVANEAGTADTQLTDTHNEHERLMAEASDEDVFFAKHRYKLHLTTPAEGVRIEFLQQYFSKKYGF